VLRAPKDPSELPVFCAEEILVQKEFPEVRIARRGKYPFGDLENHENQRKYHFLV